MNILEEKVNQSKNTLSVIHSNTYFNELLKVGKKQLSTSRYRPIFLFPVNYPTVRRDIKVCHDNNITCLDASGKVADGNESESNTAKPPSQTNANRTPFTNLILKVLDFLRIKIFFDVIYYLHYLKKRISFITEIIKTHNISLIIIGGDLVHYDTAAIIRAGHNLGIPTVIVPCTMSNALEMAESYLHDERYSLDKFSNLLVSKKFPEWKYVHHNKSLLRLPAAHALAMILLRLSPPRPWINNSSFADFIAAESTSMIEYYTREEIPRRQIVLTGSLSHDRLSESLMSATKLKADLCNKYQLSPDKPLLLSALPPDQHYLAGGRPECEFSTYHELVDFWIKSLAEVRNYNVVINLHPSVAYDDFRYLEKFGVTIAREDITSLIPLCDLFVASVSSIIRFAIACSKPVINYDVYKFNYDDYLNISGVLTVQSKKDYLEILEKLTTDGQKLSQIALKQSVYSKKWGDLDGHAGDRIVALFDQVTAHST